MNVVALIPARGGSERIPRKNLELVGAHSLVARAILVSQEVKRIREVFVSTEDAEIAAEARRYGAQVIDRPPELAESTTPMEPVVDHFIKATGISDDSIIVLLEPPATFRRASDIQAAIAYLESRPDAVGVRTLTRVETPPYFLNTVGTDGFMEPLTPVAYKSLHRPAIYRDNGLVNAFRVGAYLDAGMLMTPNVLGMEVVGAQRGLDIDWPEDLALARMAASELDGR